jgi:hypothetical protein
MDEERRSAADALVESAGANGVYEVLEQRSFGSGA